MSAYDDREQQLGEELMRHLERSILLQVIDNRWREHLFDMDYLREGIHLRGFAQIDPLVAYKNEGFIMFEELMHSIWDEFSKLVFHAEIEVEPSQGNGNGAFEPSALDYSGGTAEGQPSALEQVAVAGGAAVDTAAAQAVGGNGAGVVETVVKDEHDKVGRNDPCWCGSGKKYKKCHRGIDPVREFIRAFNERELDAFVAVLDPEVELHSSAGLRKGLEAARLWATREPGGVQQTIELEQLYEEGLEGGGAAVALIVRRWRWEEDGSPAGRGRDGLGVRAARPQDSKLAPLRGPRGEALRAGGFENEADAAG